MGRLLIAIVSTVIEEILIAVLTLWVFPLIGFRVPWWALVIFMIGWAAYSVFTYRIGTPSANKKEMDGQTNMVGCKGEATSLLAPEGMVRINGELWVAKADKGKIKPGDKIIVVGQDGLKLIVRGEA